MRRKGDKNIDRTPQKQLNQTALDLFDQNLGDEIAFSKEVKNYILQGILSGKSISKICEEYNIHYGGKNYLNRCKVSLWCFRNKDDDFMQLISLAREIGSNFLLDDIIDLEGEIRTGVLGHKSARVILESLRWRAKVQNPALFNPVMKSETHKTVDIVIRSNIPDPKPLPGPPLTGEIITVDG